MLRPLGLLFDLYRCLGIYTINQKHYFACGRHGGLMVNAFVSRLSRLGLSPGWGNCVVFLDKTLNSHGASLHPGV